MDQPEEEKYRYIVPVKTLRERVLDLAKKGIEKFNDTYGDYRGLVRAMSGYSTERLKQEYQSSSSARKSAAYTILVRRGVIKQKL